jgi:galactose mutarotase-like enzyme
MEKLENEFFRVLVSPKGAELQSIVSSGGEERLWQGNPVWWARRSPVLFPVVGKCASDRLLVGGKTYHMPQHGFARDADFELKEKNKESLSFLLQADEKSLSRFPFHFELYVNYALRGKWMRTEYIVKNPGESDMPFSIGAHPGFLIPGSGFSGCMLELEKEENSPRHLLNNGLFSGETEEVLENSRYIFLDEALFRKDAIVLKDIKSSGISLYRENKKLLEMRWNNFHHLGIWAKEGCDEYLCIEPWAGHADAAGFSGDVSRKAAIEWCAPGKERKFCWEVRFGADD